MRSLLLVALLAGCQDVGLTAKTDTGALWLRVTDLAVSPDPQGYAVLSGTVTLWEDVDGRDYVGEAVFYDAEDEVIAETSGPIAAGLRLAGDAMDFALTHPDVRLGTAQGRYERVCAEFRLDDSNVAEWTDAGCYAVPEGLD